MRSFHVWFLVMLDAKFRKRDAGEQSAKPAENMWSQTVLKIVAFL